MVLMTVNVGDDGVMMMMWLNRELWWCSGKQWNCRARLFDSSVTESKRPTPLGTTADWNHGGMPSERIGDLCESYLAVHNRFEI